MVFNKYLERKTNLRKCLYICNKLKRTVALLVVALIFVVPKQEDNLTCNLLDVKSQSMKKLLSSASGLS